MYFIIYYLLRSFNVLLLVSESVSCVYRVSRSILLHIRLVEGKKIQSMSNFVYSGSKKDVFTFYGSCVTNNTIIHILTFCESSKGNQLLLQLTLETVFMLFLKNTLIEKQVCCWWLFISSLNKKYRDDIRGGWLLEPER